MVTAYRITFDEEYQTIEKANESEAVGLALAVFERPLEPIANRWRTSEYQILYPGRKRGDVFNAYSGNFACSRSVLERIRPCVEEDCEILPITIRGLDDDDYVLIHPITVIEAIPPRDPNRSSKEMARQLIANMVAPPYRRSAFDRCCIFRDPQQSTLSICVSGFPNPDTDFYIQYMQNGFTGLEFKKVWKHEYSHKGILSSHK
ncbi:MULTISPECIES: hypothetical protein [unclassified Microbulbifer]|uniref:hypothetical protein n=1 Tax=unclassified Microbulbifer TaxID=2619833 RepID=UPI0027E42F21|nr:MULTISPECIES: hypothetical protein [unclassified Microbulbifer]